jgi:hypothetical protein
MNHVEEREFEIRLHLVATFPEEYEGTEDGFAWYERFDRGLRPRLVAAMFDLLRSDPTFSALAAPRGRDPDRGIDIEVRIAP